VRIWNLPIASPGRLCMPKIASHGKRSNSPVLDHRLATPEPLFGGLKDQIDGPVELAGLGEIPGCAEQHRGVPVMAAGLHAPLMA
jgi:hypothetical protein